MNKALKLAAKIALTLACGSIIAFLGYSLACQYKFFIEKSFNDIQKEVYSYIDYYLNFIITS